MAFLRMYGMHAGDPMPKPAPKRKSAAAGPRAKANRKRVVRAKRAQRGTQGAPKGPGKKGKIAGQILALGKDHLSGALEQLRSGNLAGAAGQALLGSGKRLGMGGGGHRSMNVANVKALRRALRRFEGFKKLVKRVDKMLPTGAKLHGSRGHSHARGHKAGCKCAVCR